MPATLITNATAAYRTAITYVAEAAAGSDGTDIVAVITPPTTDGDILIRITNADSTGTEVATIWGGGQDFLNPTADIATTMAISTTYDFILPIKDYIQASGTYKGKIVVEGASTDTEVAAVVLPFRKQ